MNPPLSQLGESVAELMHDLRGPLTNIAGWADLMSVEDDERKRRQMYEEIRHQVEQLTQMSAQTLAYARGDAPLLIRKQHLYAFARTLELRLAQELCGTKITPRVEARYVGVAAFDRGAMLRVVDNIARNAREAMEGGRGTCFTVRISAQDGMLVLEFCDDGPGIDPGVRKRLFTPFATHGKTEGHGLGLAAVKRIVEDHHGHVELRDGAPGACIVIRVPLSGDTARSLSAA
jgi:signal transduction histidine kinase